MKKIIPFALVLILAIGIVGCLLIRTDAIQFCTESLIKLNNQNELYYRSYTLEGNSNNTYMVRKGDVECWVSGENWLSYSELDNYYILSVGNERYHAFIDEAGKLIWESKNDSTNIPCPIPDLDLSIFHVESDETQEDIRNIILNYEESPKSGSQSSRAYKLEFQFKDEVIKEFRISQQITFPNAEGQIKRISYTDVVEFYELPDKMVSEIIQSNYEVALSQNR